jgi:hypothetical protein
VYVKRRILVVGAAFLAVVGFPGAAWAGGNLPSGAVVMSTVPQDYTHTTNTDYWSVVANYSSASSDFALELFDYPGTYLATGNSGGGATSFVAVDSNTGTEPYGEYVDQVAQENPGTYWLQAQYGANSMSIPTPTHQGTTGAGDPDIAFISLDSQNVTTISDIYLTAGESFWVSTPVAATELYLLEATPGKSSTYVQTRGQVAASQSTKVIDNCTLYTAKQTGWHSLVLVSDTQPVTTSPQQGTAFGLHQYNSATPNYCPMADFPGPTP